MFFGRSTAEMFYIFYMVLDFIGLKNGQNRKNVSAVIVSFKTGQDGGSCQQLRIYRGNREADMQTIISSAIDVQWSKMYYDP